MNLQPKTSENYWLLAMLLAVLLAIVLGGCQRAATVPPSLRPAAAEVPAEYGNAALFEQNEYLQTRYCDYDLEVSGQVVYGAILRNLYAGPYEVQMRVPSGDSVRVMPPVLFLPPQNIRDTVTLADRSGWPDWPAFYDEAVTKITPPKEFWFAEWSTGPLVRPLARYNCRLIKPRPQP